MSRIALSVLLVIGLACTKSFGPEGGLQIRMDEPIFALQTGSRIDLTISATLSNETDHDLYVPQAGPTNIARLEKFVDGRWELALLAPSSLAQTTPVRIPPGETLRDVLTVTAMPGSATQFLVDPIAGRYRAVYVVARAADFPRYTVVDILPEEERTSDEFEITVR